MFLASLCLFAVTSLGAGFSRTPLTLDVLMGLAGLVSAAAVPPAQGMLGVIYERPSRRKNAVFACFSAGNPLGFVAGMLSGGVATGAFGWRASFWFLAMVYVAFAVVAFFAVPVDSTLKEKFGWETWKKLDVIGNALALAGIAMFSSALRYVSIPFSSTYFWRSQIAQSRLRCASRFSYSVCPRPPNPRFSLHYRISSLGELRHKPPARASLYLQRS